MDDGVWDIEVEPEVQLWLQELPDHHYVQLERYADRLAVEGPLMPMPRSKPLGGGLHELRFHLGDNDMRISYWFAPGRRAVLLTVFQKTRMNEAAEVARARQARVLCAEQHPPAAEHDTFSRTIKGGDRS
jgi:hypothetical protein